MGKIEYCEWCNDKLNGYVYFDLPSGKYGFFCSNKCIYEAAQADFSGTKHGMCFISTAVYLSLGLNDDCYDLELLRKYRDEYLLKEKKLISDVELYYDMSPKIVIQINQEADSDEVYQYLYNKYIKEAVYKIENGEYNEAYSIYKEMVYECKMKYLHK